MSFFQLKLKLGRRKAVSYFCVFVAVQRWWLVDDVGSGFAEREKKTDRCQSSLWIICGNPAAGQEKKILLPFSFFC